MKEMIRLPKGWVWVSVGNVYSIVGGGTPSTSIPEYWQGEIPWITSADIYGLKDIRPRRFINNKAIDNSTTNLVPEGSLIIVTRVGLGKMAIANKPICFSQDLQALIGNNSYIFPEYAMYCLSQVIQIFKYKNRGTTIAGVTKKQLSNLMFPLPPLPEQHRIVAKIEELFTNLEAGIESLQKTKAQLKRYRQAVLKHAFEGKLTEKWREVNMDKLETASESLGWVMEKRYKNSKGKNKELPFLDVTDLPELPREWIFEKLENCSEIITKGESPNWQGYEYVAEGIPFIRSENVLWGSINLTDTVKIPDEFHIKLKRSQIRKEDVLINLVGASIGRCAVIPSTFSEGNINQAVALIRTNTALLPTYLMYLLLSPDVQKNIHSSKVETARPNISLGDLRNLIIPLPACVEQNKIVEEIEKYYSLADEVERTVEQCLKQSDRLRQSILKRAFEGKLVPQSPNDEPAEKLLE